ncbi:hypothetical protein ACLQ2N_07690 [Streptomyces sp. DT224]|uniref:hypothetical protein n=1 Tax=Streptomyces sp. DT224 TaxID=3393426 RepID=UPI003CEF8963
MAPLYEWSPADAGSGAFDTETSRNSGSHSDASPLPCRAGGRGPPQRLVKQADADAQRCRLTGEGEKAHRAAALGDAVRIG